MRLPGDLAVLEERRRLVSLSADLQRATLALRLRSVGNRPRVAILGAVVALGLRPAVRRLAFASALMAFRAWRRRRSLR